MKRSTLVLALGLCALTACGPAFVNSETQPFLLKESQVPASLPLPTVDYEFFGNSFSEQARVVEQQTSGSGKKFLVHGYATTIGGAGTDAKLSLYYQGRTDGDDHWVIQWEFDGNKGKEAFTYEPGTTRNFVDTDNFKLGVN